MIANRIDLCKCEKIICDNYIDELGVVIDIKVCKDCVSYRPRINKEKRKKAFKNDNRRKINKR